MPKIVSPLIKRLFYNIVKSYLANDDSWAFWFGKEAFAVGYYNSTSKQQSSDDGLSPKKSRNKKGKYKMPPIRIVISKVRF